MIGRHVVLAVALEADAAQHDHLVVAFGLLEGLGQDRLGVLAVAREIFLIGARHARRRLGEPVAVGVIARPADDGAEGRLDFGAAGANDLVHGRVFTFVFQG